MGLYSFSEDINAKYAEIEEDLNKRLELILAREQKLNLVNERPELLENKLENETSSAKAMERNENTIKVLFLINKI